MSNQHYGMNFGEVERLVGKLNTAGMDTQGGIPHLRRTQEGLQAAIQQLRTATGGMHDGIELLRRVQTEHVNHSVGTVHQVLSNLDLAITGDPTVSLSDNLTAWKTHGEKINEEIQQVITNGTPIEQTLDQWIQPNGTLSQLEQAVDALAASLGIMASAIDDTNHKVNTLKGKTQDLAETGRQSFANQ